MEKPSSSSVHFFEIESGKELFLLEEEVDAVYLNWDEIKKIFQVDLSRYPHLVDYRDDFVLGCMTGLRFSDFSKLMKDDLRGDMLFKKQQKSDHWVVIPLRPEAKKILDDRFPVLRTFQKRALKVLILLD